MKRVAIYLRVSTSKQDTENQRRELEAVAERSGWKVVKVFEDAGISGAKGRDQRPGLDAMMKAVNAKEFDMVASWSVDRLCRSLTELLSILSRTFMKRVSVCSFTSKDSIPRHPRARRCFKCLAFSPSSSGGSFGSGSIPGSPAPRPTARSWVAAGLSPPWRREY